jgi:ribosomal protein S12 methylthiotransferase accessory factor
VQIEIELPESFPERYREAVVRAAAQCSVKKHLASPPQILMRTVEPALRSR